MVELHFPAGHEHPAVLMMDLQLSDAQHGEDRGRDMDHFRSLVLQCIYDGLEYTAVWICCPDDNICKRTSGAASTVTA